MQLRFDENEIPFYAARYQQPVSEAPLLGVVPIVRNQGYMDVAQLGLVLRWKANRIAGRVTRNSESYARAITSFALSTKDERARIEVLTGLDGFQWPSASAILHLFHLDSYPLLDFRALWSLTTAKPPQYSFDFWWKYVVFTRELAARNNMDMRTLDRALWQYSKEIQPLKSR